MKRIYVAVLTLLSFAALVAIPGFAQQESIMNVHVDTAIAIPGHVLTPGNYVFQLSNFEAYPGFVEIRSADGQRNFGYIQVFPARRQKFDGTKLVLSKPDQAGLEHLKAWYFPGNHYGYRFIYSKRDLRNADLVAERMHSQPKAGV